MAVLAWILLMKMDLETVEKETRCMTRILVVMWTRLQHQDALTSSKLTEEPVRPSHASVSKEMEH